MTYSIFIDIMVTVESTQEVLQRLGRKAFGSLTWRRSVTGSSEKPVKKEAVIESIERRGQVTQE